MANNLFGTKVFDDDWQDGNHTRKKDEGFIAPELRARSQNSAGEIRAGEVAPAPAPRLPTASDERKSYPMCRGLLDYFPDALAEVARVSHLGNEKHNPGEALHHSRGKSSDHADCIVRHLTERGGYDVIVVAGFEHKILHSVAMAWRALALAQEEIEAARRLPLPRGARLDKK
jgi:hypothetical protein